MNARTLLWTVIMSIACLGTLASAIASDITVVQGDPLTINGDTGVRGPVTTASATFSMPAINYLRDITVGSVSNPSFTDTVRVDIKPGVYPLTIRLAVNGETISYEHVDVHVIARPSQSQLPAEPSTPVLTVKAPSTVSESLSIPPMPDLSPGELYILPIKVTGQGTYLIEIPELPFGTYEIPGPITVSGERIVPVLIRVDANAEPGTYTIPIHMAGLQTNARVRILKYTTRPSWTPLFIISGIVLLVVALLLALVLGRSPREPRIERRRTTETRTDDEDPVVTYY